MDSYLDNKEHIRELGKDSFKLGGATFIIEHLCKENSDENSFFSSHINFDYDVVRVASDGGSVSVWHKSSNEFISSIVLYDSLLNYVNELKLKNESSIFDFYITQEEMIIVLFENTEIMVLDQRGNVILSKMVCEMFCNNEFMTLAKFYDEGLFVFTSKGKVIHVKDFGVLEFEIFAESDYFIPLLKTVEIVPENENNEISIYGYVDVPETEINNLLILIQKDNIQEQEMGFDRINLLRFSSDYTCSFLLSQDSFLVCYGTFEFPYKRFIIQQLSVKDAMWCGNSSIVLISDDGYLRIIGDTNETYNLKLSKGCVLCNEVDGVRVITNNDVLYIREVSDSSLSFINCQKDSPIFNFYMNVSDPKSFVIKDPLVEIKSQIPEILKGCLDACEFFRDPKFVRELFGIVSKFKSDIHDGDICEYTNALTFFKITSSLSQKPFNMPLTKKQLMHLGYEGLILRICNRFLHYHAIKIADFIGNYDDVVYSHWGNSMIRSHETPENIVKRIKDIGYNFNYVELSTCAFDIASQSIDEDVKSQKEELALLLLKENTVKSKSIPLLIRREQWSAALETALNSYDSTLVSYVINAVIERNQIDTIKQQILQNPISLDSWLRLYPDEKDKADLLEKCGLSRLSRFTKIQHGVSLETIYDEAKSNNSSIDIELYSKLYKLKEIARKLDIEYNDNLTPYTLFDLVIQEGDSKKMIQASKLLELMPDEILRCKIDHCINNPNDELLRSAGKEAREDDLVDAVIDLAMKGRKHEAEFLITLLTKEKRQIVYDAIK